MQGFFVLLCDFYEWGSKARMNQLRLILSAFAATLLLGCESTGGTTGGLLPAPKFLKGEINADIYTALDRSFSVKVPHKKGSYEYTYMAVKERYGELGAYVSFGPAAIDQSIYRVETAKRTSQSIAFDKALALHVVDNYKTQLQQGYGATLEEVTSRADTMRGRQMYYWQFKQITSSGKSMSDRTATLIHEVYVMDLEKGLAMVWVQTPADASNVRLTPRDFAESMVMY